MAICSILITLIIFFDSIGYAVFEIKDNKNRLGGISVIILSLFMLVFVNFSLFTFV